MLKISTDNNDEYYYYNDYNANKYIEYAIKIADEAEKKAEINEMSELESIMYNKFSDIKKYQYTNMPIHEIIGKLDDVFQVI